MIKITTVEPSALDGIIRDGAPDGLFMALAGPRSMFWEAAEVRAGRVAKIYGDFPAVIGWLFLRARVLPGRCRPKNRIVGQDNPWRVKKIREERE